MRILQLALALTVLGWVLAWQRTRALPELAEIAPQLLQEPAQRPTGRATFGFEYRKLAYEVKPMASYDLYGLVVSHNDIQGIADIYHDADSVDTKDLCVIWGDNLRSGDYRKASFESTPHWCFVSWHEGVKFDLSSMSNNHLVTDSDELRAALDAVHVGDQVHFKGMLANYRDMRHPEYWRQSSLVRTDQGDGACEVVFFEELEVLNAHAAQAWKVRRVLPWVAGALCVLIVIVAGITTPGRRSG